MLNCLFCQYVSAFTYHYCPSFYQANLISSRPQRSIKKTNHKYFYKGC